jgi:hypothetical protein
MKYYISILGIAQSRLIIRGHEFRFSRRQAASAYHSLTYSIWSLTCGTFQRWVFDFGLHCTHFVFMVIAKLQCKGRIWILGYVNIGKYWVQSDSQNDSGISEQVIIAGIGYNVLIRHI